MNGNWDFLEPLNDEERIDMVADGLAVSVQMAVQKAMVRGGLSQKLLAERLGVSTARVSQILSAHGRNLTLKTLGKIAHALGEDFEFVALHDLRELKSRVRGREHDAGGSTVGEIYEIDRNPWQDTTAISNRFTIANANTFPKKIAA
jgi:transcriptional regulator with XRE-family HTH domain